MLILDSTALIAIEADARGIPLLVELDFLSGTAYYTTWPINLTIGGHTYIGTGSLLSIRGMSENSDNATRTLTFGLSVVDTALLAIAVGNSSAYRRRRARVYMQLIDATFQPVGAPVQRWTGFMDKVSIERTAPGMPEETTPGSGTILLQCSRAGAPISRREEGMRSTNAQQQTLYPGDTGLEYQQTLIETPSLWLSKRFQQQ